MELSLGKGGCTSRVQRTPSDSFSSTSSRSCSLSSHSSNLRAHKKKHDILAKIIVLGESTVGKSCLTNRYVNDEFDFNSISTVGMDIRIKNLDYDGKVLKVQIWDTAGQERYRGITKAFHRGANGVIFAFDITNRDSFQKLKNWIADFQKSTTTVEPVPMTIVGNKADLEDKRAVEFDEAKEWCDYWDIPYFETSARYGLGVEQAFSYIARQAAVHSLKRKQKKTQELKSKSKKRCTNCTIS